MPLNCANVTIIETGFNGSSEDMFTVPKNKRRKNNFTWKDNVGWVDNRTQVLSSNTANTSVKKISEPKKSSGYMRDMS